MTLRRIVLLLVAVSTIVLSGCGAFTDSTTTTTETPTTFPATTSAKTPTTSGTPSTTTTVYTLTDRTPEVWMELFPNPGFTGQILVQMDNETVFNESFSDYAGFGEYKLTTDFDGTSHTITVTVNGTTEWERRVGPTESYELNILKNGTVEVRSHAIR